VEPGETPAAVILTVQDGQHQNYRASRTSYATLAWPENASRELIPIWRLKSPSGYEIVQAGIDPITGAERSGLKGSFQTSRKIVQVA
jgi:hypothetical protein